MELTNFVDNFASLFENMEREDFTPETKFHDLEDWDSLMALSTIAMIDELYQIKIKGDQIRNAVTVGDLFLAVQNNS